MKSDSGREGHFIRNADVRAEFEAMLKNPDLLRHYTNSITNRLRFSIISRYERNITPEDILSILKLKIYAGNLEWNKKVYSTFKHFMHGQIQNILRNKEKSLKIRFEKVEKLENEGKIFDVKPTKSSEVMELHVEINKERLGEKLVEDEDRFAYHNKPRLPLDPVKFDADVRAILKDVKSTDLLVVYSELMAKKTPREIKAEYGFTERDYDNIQRRLIYKLRRELPKEYMEMFSI